MDTSLKPASAVVSLASRLSPFLTQLKDAVKDFEAAKKQGPASPTKVERVLDTIEHAIQDDTEMKARPGLEALRKTLSSSKHAAMSDAMRLTYFTNVIAKLTDEINAPEGGRRRRRRITRKGPRKAKRATRRR